MTDSNKQDIDNIIKNSLAVIRPGRFAMVKVQEFEKNAEYFCLTNDGEELTMVVEEANLSQVKYTDIQKWFRLIQLAVSVPFFSIGFLAKVASAIADKGINILVISTFSNDYILIRENDVVTTIKTLAALGFRTRQIRSTSSTE
jgi:hypothetical protein